MAGLYRSCPPQSKNFPALQAYAVTCHGHGGRPCVLAKLAAMPACHMGRQAWQACAMPYPGNAYSPLPCLQCQDISYQTWQTRRLPVCPGHLYRDISGHKRTWKTITLGFPPFRKRHAISGTSRACVRLPGKSANSGDMPKNAATLPLALSPNHLYILFAGQYRAA